LKTPSESFLTGFSLCMLNAQMRSFYELSSDFRLVGYSRLYCLVFALEQFDDGLLFQ